MSQNDAAVDAPDAPSGASANGSTGSPAASQGHMLRRGVTVMASMVSLHKLPFFIGVFGATVYGTMTVASSWALGRVTDKVIVPRFEDGEVATATVVAGVALIIGIGLAKAAGIVTRRIGATVAVARIGATLRSRVASHYARVPYEFHQRTPTGQLLAHTDSDVIAAADSLSPVPFSLGVLTILVTTVIWLLLTDPWLALVGLTIFPLIIGLNLLYQRVVEHPVEQVQERVASVSNVAHESFDGALTVKALGGEAIESDRFGTVAEHLRDAKIRVATLRATFETVLDAVPTVAIVAVIAVGAWRVDTGAVTVGTVVGFVSLFTLLVWPLRLIAYVLGDMPRAVVGYDRLMRVLDEPVDARHGLGARAGGPGSRTAAPDGSSPDGSARGVALQLENVSFGYDRGSPVIRGVGFDIAPGRRVAVVGPTGSGKSSLVLLVAGLLQAADGPHPDRRPGPVRPDHRGAAGDDRHRLPGGLPLRRVGEGEHHPGRGRLGHAPGRPVGRGARVREPAGRRLRDRRR